VAAAKEADPTMTTELAVREGARFRMSQAGSSIPAFWWYWQAGYDKRWNTPGWGDDSLPRKFDDYFNEAGEKGWGDGPMRPQPGDQPRVLIECGGNMLRRTRGGKTALLDTLWPKLKTIVSIDFRINQTGLYSDYVLPAAQSYEKLGTAISTPHILNLTFSDAAAKPAGEALDEWDIFSALLLKIGERAAARGLDEYTDVTGNARTYAELADRYTPHEHVRDRELLMDEGIRDSALAGTLPPGTTLETLREKGHVRFTDWGLSPMTISQASPLKPDETHAPFRDHVELGTPFPTYARRAQFYIDHDWFIEAGEQLPMHKPNPAMGGDYPLRISSGHNRWSVHSMNQANSVILGTHRGEPTVVVNVDDAGARGVEDDDLIRIFNDIGEFVARASVAPGVKPGQIISYNGWAGFQYSGWSGANEIEAGMVKWIGFAGGYGHLRYTPMEWQPVPVDRWGACDFEKASAEGS
jgi:nitrate reductase alpha subunit